MSEQKNRTLVLIRHGESEWNLANRFTGWCDVRLSEKGVQEAQSAGDRLKAGGFVFDTAYTSLLVRAITTLHLLLERMELLWVPEHKCWQLNERHYGGLQGYNKAEKAAEVGDEQVHIWRRSYDTPPPPLDESSPMNPRGDARYRGLDPRVLPLTESLADTVARVIPFWEEHLLPRVTRGERLIVAAHGNSLRALVKHLDGIPDDKIIELNIPTGQPLVYELDERGQALSRRYLD